MRGSEFVLDYVQLLHYKCHKKNLNRGGPYTDSPDWIKNRKAAINPLNKTFLKILFPTYRLVYVFMDLHEISPSENNSK